RSSSVASTSVNTRFTRSPRSLWGAPPAPLAPRPTGRTKNDHDEKAQSTVTHVVGLICYPCPRPPRPGTKNQGPRTNRAAARGSKPHPHRERDVEVIGIERKGERQKPV